MKIIASRDVKWYRRFTLCEKFLRTGGFAGVVAIGLYATAYLVQAND